MSSGKDSTFYERRFLMLGTVALGLVSTRAAASPPVAPRFLQELMNDLAKVRRSEADFDEVRRISRLTKPLISSGHLIYVRPHYLAMVTEAPRHEKLVVDRDRLFLTEGSAAGHVIDLADHPGIGALVEAIRGTLAGDLSELQKSFSVSAIGTLAGWRLVLIPRVPTIARLLRSLTFEGRGNKVRHLTAIETDGDGLEISIKPAP